MENKTFFFIELRLLSFHFSKVFIPNLQILDQNALCLKVLETSVTLKISNPQSQKKKKKCRVHDQSHTQWCREQKKSIIMKYYLSAVPVTWKVRNAEISSHLEKVILESHHV